MLTGQPASAEWPAEFNNHYVVDDVQRDRLSKHIGRTDWSHCIIEHSFNVPLFCRLLAKIAHGYAVAHHGLGAFDAFLPPVVLGEEVSGLVLRVVGGEAEVPDPIETPDRTKIAGHIVQPETWDLPTGERVICMKIRLFANSKTPIYRVVAGRLKTA